MSIDTHSMLSSTGTYTLTPQHGTVQEGTIRLDPVSGNTQIFSLGKWVTISSDAAPPEQQYGQVWIDSTTGGYVNWDYDGTAVPSIEPSWTEFKFDYDNGVKFMTKDGKQLSLEELFDKLELYEKMFFFLLHNIPKNIWGHKGQRAMELLNELLEMNGMTIEEQEGPKHLEDELFEI